GKDAPSVWGGPRRVRRLGRRRRRQPGSRALPAATAVRGAPVWNAARGRAIPVTTDGCAQACVDSVVLQIYGRTRRARRQPRRPRPLPAEAEEPAEGAPGGPGRGAARPHPYADAARDP